MADPTFDAHRIVEILELHRVAYVLVGGFAAILYGSRRPTEDIDITPATSMDNLHRLSLSLRDLDARIRVAGIPDGLDFDTSAEALRGVTMLNLRTAFGDCDLTFAPSGFSTRLRRLDRGRWRAPHRQRCGQGCRAGRHHSKQGKRQPDQGSGSATRTGGARPAPSPGQHLTTAGGRVIAGRPDCVGLDNPAVGAHSPNHGRFA